MVYDGTCWCISSLSNRKQQAFKNLFPHFIPKCYKFIDGNVWNFFSSFQSFSLSSKSRKMFEDRKTNKYPQIPLKKTPK